METPEIVTVYRSMDDTAKDDCETIADLLVGEGLSPQIVDDSAPGVPEGVCEVQVPAEQASRAEQIIAANPLPDEVDNVDEAHELDLVRVYHSEGSTTAELEATAIKNLLEADGIAAVMVGDSVLPNLPFEVRVAQEQAEPARQLIAEAIRSGPAAADEAARLSERGGSTEAEPGA